MKQSKPGNKFLISFFFCMGLGVFWGLFVGLITYLFGGPFWQAFNAVLVGFWFCGIAIGIASETASGG